MLPDQSKPPNASKAQIPNVVFVPQSCREPPFLCAAGGLGVGLGCVALLAYSAWAFAPTTLALVLCCVVTFWVCVWACNQLVGVRNCAVFVALALGLGWFAEQMGSTRGWFFGRYTYTDVLGPRLGEVPLVIPLMWFAVAFVGYVMACLMLWKKPVLAQPSFRRGLLTAWLAAMVITAFDLGADPYMVFVLKAWIMQKTDGGWFGETLQGFAGWMAVSLMIVGAFQALASPRRALQRGGLIPQAALVPVVLYAFGLAFQVVWGHPIEVRAIAFFAMGLPVVVALAGWHQWKSARRLAPYAQSEAGVDLQPMVLVADPLADQTVDAILGPWTADGEATHEGRERLVQANRLMAAWTHNGALATGWAHLKTSDPQLARVLEDYTERAQILPSWADRNKIACAESLFMEHGPVSCALLFCSSLPGCYVMPQLAEVLHIAGQLEQHTEHRIRQTAAMVFPVMMKGGLTDTEGAGVAQVLKVRLIHASIRHFILRGSPQRVAGEVASRAPNSSSTDLYGALAAHGWDAQRQGMPCNQVELAYTLLTFSFFFLEGMRTLGQGLPVEDEEAYLHAWNVMGHVLGVREELMAWNMDQAQSLFERMQNEEGQLLPGQPDPRPPLGKALVAAMERSIVVPVIRGLPVPLTRWLIGPTTSNRIGIDERVSWATSLVFVMGRWTVAVLDGVLSLFSPGFSLSRLFVRVIGYHFLTRFLMDQTRPLALPERVLKPMTDLIGSWGEDRRAPSWLARLEARWTTTGRWQSNKDHPAKASDPLHNQVNP